VEKNEVAFGANCLQKLASEATSFGLIFLPELKLIEN